MDDHRRGGSFAVLGALLVLTTACASGAPGAGSREPTVTVVAGFYPLAEAAERVGGERVRVENLTPPGAEPHDIEIDPRQVDALLDADVVLYLGGGFQPAVAETARRSSGVALDVLEAVGALEEADPRAHTDEHGEGHDHDGDPHVWLDPLRMIEIVDRVEAALVEADPAGEAEYRAGAEAYREELQALHRALEEGLADCEQRLLVTSHAAFGYLADRYGLTQQAVSGLTPEAEPDPRRLGELIELVEEEGVETIFAEGPASADVAETLAREAGVSVATLRPIEGLTPEEIEAGEDYASLMRGNLSTLRDALGCT